MLSSRNCRRSSERCTGGNRRSASAKQPIESLGSSSSSRMRSPLTAWRAAGGVLVGEGESVLDINDGSRGTAEAQVGCGTVAVGELSRQQLDRFVKILPGAARVSGHEFAEPSGLVRHEPRRIEAKTGRVSGHGQMPIAFLLENSSLEVARVGPARFEVGCRLGVLHGRIEMPALLIRLELRCLVEAIASASKKSLHLGTRLGLLAGR